MGAFPEMAQAVLMSSPAMIVENFARKFFFIAGVLGMVLAFQALSAGYKSPTKAPNVSERSENVEEAVPALSDGHLLSRYPVSK